MIRLIVILLMPAFTLTTQAQDGCIHLDAKGRKALKESVKTYMADTLAIDKITISDPSFSPYEKDYDYVYKNRDNCDSLAGIPVYSLRVENRRDKNNWEFMLDINGNVLIVIRENSNWYREY